MKSFYGFITEEFKDGGLTIFDIDDTLFKTTARVTVKKGNKVVKRLDPHTFNTYELKDGEEFDFKEFRDAEKFYNESKPIKGMMAKAKAILKNTLKNELSRVIIVTARDDFDDREKFLDTFRKYGFDIDRVRVERAGKIKDIRSTAISKMVIIRNYLNTKQFSRVRLFDDSTENLKAFLHLQKEFEDIKFEAYFVKEDGTIRTVK